MRPEGWTTMRAAWDAALYGPTGFYRREQPADHFRTSAHVSGAFADAVLAVARTHGAEMVVDVGSGSGELLEALRVRDRQLDLVGVDLRPRPAALPHEIEWRVAGAETAEAVADVAVGRTVVIANELLDNVPCDVVELTDDGLRDVEVEAGGDQQRLGGEVDAAAAGWLQRWWPLETAGQRAVVGLARDMFWTRVCAAVRDGVCIAIDFGHTRSDRPIAETPTSYRRGRQHPARFDARHDVTAHVAVDSVAAAVGGLLDRQRAVVARAVPPPSLPSGDLAHTDPAGYLRLLSAASHRGELTSSPGLGDFWWIVAPASGRARVDADSMADAATLAIEGEVAR